MRANEIAPYFHVLVLAGISYLPFSGILVWNASVAEHWLYLPTAFLFLAVAIEAAELVQAKNERKDRQSV